MFVDDDTRKTTVGRTPKCALTDNKHKRKPLLLTCHSLFVIIIKNSVHIDKVIQYTPNREHREYIFVA